MGIAAGKTLWQDVKKQLATYEVLAGHSVDEFDAVIGSLEVSIQRNFQDSADPVVNVLAVGDQNWKEPLFQFGYILERFGPPCGLSDVDLANSSIVFEYPTFTIWIYSSAKTLNPDSAVTYLRLYNPTNRDIYNTACESGEPRAISPAWLGFTSVERYASYQRERGGGIQ
jgi:hypothetical protein